MKRTSALLGLILAAAFAASCSGASESERRSKGASQRAETSQQPARPAPAQSRPDPHAHGDTGGRVPAFQTAAEELKNLPPTLTPEKFAGRQRLGYQAVREIPQTIAQLPCFCHCDEGFGHKSLHSCFVDDHASHCAVCIDEALMAYQMQKEQGLTAPQISERIVARYSSGQ